MLAFRDLSDGGLRTPEVNRHPRDHCRDGQTDLNATRAPSCRTLVNRDDENRLIVAKRHVVATLVPRRSYGVRSSCASRGGPQLPILNEAPAEQAEARQAPGGPCSSSSAVR